MTAIGLFEARTKFSEVCKRVAARGETVRVTRRGRPLVTIGPIPAPKGRPASVWDGRADFEKRHGRLTEGFTVPPRQKHS